MHVIVTYQCTLRIVLWRAESQSSAFRIYIPINDWLPKACFCGVNPEFFNPAGNGPFRVTTKAIKI